MNSDSNSFRWSFYSSKYEYRNVFYDFHYPWAGHVYFAYDLIRNVKPKTIVELGTYKGTSFFSMCQALKDGNIKSNITAIDSWEGETHTGKYGKCIYQTFCHIIKKFYSKVKVHTLKMYFDDAIKRFPDKSIDLLHIDGLHTYDAVKHDYEKWKDKVSDRGIILFHDIAVKEKGFGVYQFWNEIAKDNKNCLEFTHSNGLGVLTKDLDTFRILKSIKPLLIKRYTNRFIKDNILKNKRNNQLLLYIKELENKNSDVNLMLDSNLKILNTIQETKFFKLWDKYRAIKESFFNIK